jgi:hypothetical protein
MQPALTADEWMGGIDKDPNLISFKDGHHLGGGPTSPSGTSTAEKYNKYDTFGCIRYIWL